MDWQLCNRVQVTQPSVEYLEPKQHHESSSEPATQQGRVHDQLPSNATKLGQESKQKPIRIEHK
jgi:hypothetical protein